MAQPARCVILGPGLAQDRIHLGPEAGQAQTDGKASERDDRKRKKAKKTKKARRRNGKRVDKDGFRVPPKLRTSEIDVFSAAEADEIDVGVADGEKTVLFVGDVMTWGDPMKRHIAGGDTDYPFAATAAVIRKADFAVGNLEGPVATRAALRTSIRFPYKMEPVVLQGIQAAGFDLVSTANNHVYDCSEAGVLETLQYLEKANLPQIGTGENLDAALRPHVADIAGTKIAFLGYISPESWIPDGKEAKRKGAFEDRVGRMPKRMMARSDRAGTVVVDSNIISEAVRSADKLADLVVVYLHWGVRYEQSVFHFQSEIAHAAVDAGADLVVGHHVHTWQPIELYRDRIIVYGLGNFAFDSRNPRAAEGLVARAIVSGARFDRVEIHPLATRNVDEKIDFQSKFFKGDSATDLLERLAKMSEPLGARLEIEGERGIVRAPEASHH